MIYKMRNSKNNWLLIIIFLSINSICLGDILRLHTPLKLNEMIELSYYSVGYGYWGASFSPDGTKIALNAGIMDNKDESGKLTIMYTEFEKIITSDIKLQKSAKYQWLDDNNIVFTSSNITYTYNISDKSTTNYNKDVSWKTIELTNIKDQKYQYVLPIKSVKVYKKIFSPYNNLISIVWPNNKREDLYQTDNLLDFTDKYFLFEHGVNIYLYRYN
jgi:hypothetical protein